MGAASQRLDREVPDRGEEPHHRRRVGLGTPTCTRWTKPFPDLLLEVHGYPFNNPTGGNTWTKQLLDRSSQGNYSRTIVGEWGTGVRGANFSSQGNNDFMVAFANAIKDNKMGSCWWPGS